MKKNESKTSTNDMQWFPIESAPKDGTYLLLCVGACRPVVGRWQKERGCWDNIEPDDMPSDHAWYDYLKSEPEYKPTHWMPLPEPPK